MPVLFIFVNYVLLLFLGLLTLSGHLPIWSLGLLPVLIWAQYRVYVRVEPAGPKFSRA